MPFKVKNAKLYMKSDKDDKYVEVTEIADAEVSLEISKEDDELISKIANNHNHEASFEVELDLCVRRLYWAVMDPKLASNNWRKLHGLPMWRLK